MSPAFNRELWGDNKVEGHIDPLVVESEKQTLQCTLVPH